MEDDLREVLSLIIHRRMTLKAELEVLRSAETFDLKKSYKGEIDQVLDEMNELEKIYKRLTNSKTTG
ncbi:hypothetical protein AGMMS50239_03850 [Bacteroidia bacterium]|nr:hypothetical protein AGMMS50239_03850 [Bacteroidia bacterium]